MLGVRRIDAMGLRFVGGKAGLQVQERSAGWFFVRPPLQHKVR
jgi:hypothetical protein